MPTWLVTGATGFLGATALRAVQKLAGVEAVGLGRRPPAASSSRFVLADLEDSGAIVAAIVAVRPDVVIHAAGRTPPAGAEALYRANTLGTACLIEALRHAGRPVRLVVVGSAAELGPVAVEDLPVAEDHRPRPADAYGMSKHLAACAALACGPPIESIVARVFNPIGPGLPVSQALGRFAAEVASRPSEDHRSPHSFPRSAWERHDPTLRVDARLREADGTRSVREGDVPTRSVGTSGGRSVGTSGGRRVGTSAESRVRLVVGDLIGRRDFIDVRDVAGALVALGLRGRAGEIYHVGTGRSRSIGEGLARLVERSGLTVEVAVDPALAARRGVADSRADARKIAAHTGWSATIAWEQSLDDLWDEAAGRARPALIGGASAV